MSVGDCYWKLWYGLWRESRSFGSCHCIAVTGSCSDFAYFHLHLLTRSELLIRYYDTFKCRWWVAVVTLELYKYSGAELRLLRSSNLRCHVVNDNVAKRIACWLHKGAAEDLGNASTDGCCAAAGHALRMTSVTISWLMSHRCLLAWQTVHQPIRVTVRFRQLSFVVIDQSHLSSSIKVIQLNIVLVVFSI